MGTLYIQHALQKQPQQYFMCHFGECMYKVCKWPFRPSHCQRLTANSNVYFSKIQPLIQSFSGNESNRSLWVEEIAFPELHFTAWCWIHSSSNSFWMFHHRLDPRGWYNPLITHIHPPTMRRFRIMHVGDMRVNHLLGERFDCIFNVGGYKHDRMSSQAATVTSVCQNSFGGVKLSLLIYSEKLKVPFSCGHMNVYNIIIFNSYFCVFTPADFRFEGKSLSY